MATSTSSRSGATYGVIDNTAALTGNIEYVDAGYHIVG
jgi:enoyl-[acyl-carrier-protein] reductase (NADH)